MPQASPCGMPSAGFHRNGTLFVVCGNGRYLVATDSWKDGAWRFVTKLVPPPKWEDPTMWWDARGHWHIIYHVWAADPFAKHHEPASRAMRTVSAHVPPMQYLSLSGFGNILEGLAFSIRLIRACWS